MIEFPASMRQVAYAEPNCQKCMRNRNSRLPLYGSGGKGILILFDKQESIQQISKTYAVGKKFEFIRDCLAQYNIYIDEDCWVSSIIQCYADKGNDLTGAECCKPLLDKLLKQLKPKLVIGVGNLLPSLVLPAIHGGTSIDRTHGWVHNNRQYHCNMVFTYAPHSTSDINSSKKTIDEITIERDIHRAILSLGAERVEWKPEMECVEILSDSRACEFLKQEVANPTVRYTAFDYESNSLRPYNEDSKLYCVSICSDIDKSYSFMLNDTTLPYFRQWLQTPQVIKIAHNSAFERTWSIVKAGAVPVRLCIDTMQMAHVMDNRTGILSIKFLAPVLLGSQIWNAHIEPYLEPTSADEKKSGSYAINQIDKIPRRQLLTYCAIDSLVEYRAYLVLKDMLKHYYENFKDEDTVERAKGLLYA